jgi:hypothetical protein
MVVDIVSLNTILLLISRALCSKPMRGPFYTLRRIIFESPYPAGSQKLMV